MITGRTFPILSLCSRIELLTELFHDVDTLGAQSRTDRRCGIGLATLALQLYKAGYFFRHY